MKTAALIIAALFCLILFGGHLSIAQDKYTKTDITYISESAGIYLSTVASIEAYKVSYCSEILPGTLSKIPTVNIAYTTQVAPYLTHEYKSEFLQAFKRIRPKMENEGQYVFNKMLKAATMQYDKKTACAFAAGLLTGVYGRSLENWNETKIKFGLKSSDN